MITIKTCLIIPARNEAESLPTVLENVPAVIDRVIVVDNGSTDNTGQVAREHGATVVYEPNPGYGLACLAGLSAVQAAPPDMVAFADADGSDDLAILGNMTAELAEGKIDFAVAVRMHPEPGAMSLPQKMGNRLAVALIRLFWKYNYYDLGPMRVITWKALKNLSMADPNFGWTVEMQIKALSNGLRIRQFPTAYKRRTAGRSKVSRSFSGTLKAGIKIIGVILLYAYKAKISKVTGPS